MHSFAVALLLSSAAAFAPKAASRPTVAVAAMPSQDELKKQVGYQAIDDYVTSGMKVGLGTGSTAAFAVERLGMLLKDGTLKDIIAVPTSVRTKEQAEELGIPLTTLDEFSRLDVAIDGADEVDPDLNLVKGGGGALLREKMVEIVADKFIVIVDESKLCDALGPGFPVRSRRPAVLRCLHAIDATRVHQTRSWPFGPSRATAMLRAGTGRDHAVLPRAHDSGRGRFTRIKGQVQARPKDGVLLKQPERWRQHRGHGQWQLHRRLGLR